MIDCWFLCWLIMNNSRMTISNNRFTLFWIHYFSINEHLSENKSLDLIREKINSIVWGYSQTKWGQTREKKGTLTTTIYSDHTLLVRSIPSSSSTNQHTILFSLGRITSTVETTAIYGHGRWWMKTRERRKNKRTNERTSFYTQEKKKFFFLFFFFYSSSLGFELWWMNGHRSTY
jgi:hypothetical protein